MLKKGRRSELITDIILMTLILLPLITMSTVGVFWVVYSIMNMI